MDEYHVGFGDIINDSDGQGTIFYGNEQVASLSFSQGQATRGQVWTSDRNGVASITALA